MPSALAPKPAPATCVVSSPAAGVVGIHLAGDWRLTGSVPDATEIVRKLQAGGLRQVQVSAPDLGTWDSALLGFLMPVLREAQARSVVVDLQGLPEGAQRLIHLALEGRPAPVETASEETEGAFTQMARMTERAAHEVVAELAFLGEFTLALGRLLRGRSQLRMRDLALQLQECGAEALPIVALIGFLVGSIIGFVGATVLETYGATLYTANMVAIAVTRELGALMTAIILSGRTGAAFAANLGTMRTNEEIEALQTVGLHPMDFLVVPRVVGLCLMIPLLTAFADLAGIAGGLLVTTSMPNVTLAAYLHATLKSLTLTQVLIGLGKSILFGAIIALVGCRRGLECGRSAAAVGLAATSAVVVSITLVIALDGLLAVVFNALHL